MKSAVVVYELVKNISTKINLKQRRFQKLAWAGFGIGLIMFQISYLEGEKI